MTDRAHRELNPVVNDNNPWHKELKALRGRPEEAGPPAPGPLDKMPGKKPAEVMRGPMPVPVPVPNPTDEAFEKVIKQQHLYSQKEGLPHNYAWTKDKNGHFKLNDNKDDRHVVFELDKNGKAQIIETRDARGTLTQLKGAGIEIQEPDGKTTAYPEGKIDGRGTVSFATKNGIKHDRHWHGYREDRNADDSIIKTSEILTPNITLDKTKISENETLRIRLLDGKKISEAREFAKPTSVTVETMSGKQEFNNVRTLYSYYNPLGKPHEKDEPIAQTLFFAGAGLSKTISISNELGEINFHAHQLDILRSKENKPIEEFHSVKGSLHWQQPWGNETTLPARSLSFYKDQDTGAGICKLDSKRDFFPKNTSIYYIKAGDKTNIEGDLALPAKQQAEVRNKVDVLMGRFMSDKKEKGYGGLFEERKEIRDELINLGREALPRLMQYAQSAASIERGDPRTGLNAIAEDIIRAQYEKPLPEKLTGEIQHKSVCLYLTEGIVSSGAKLTSQQRDFFEKVKKYADSPIQGLNPEEREFRLERVLTEPNLSGPQLGALDLLPLKSNSSEVQPIAEYLKIKPQNDHSHESDLLYQADRFPSQARSFYAAALVANNTHTQGDKELAITLLTEAVTHSPPGTLPVRTRIGMEGIHIEDASGDAFVKAVSTCKAYDDPKFVAACRQFIPNGDEFLNGLRTGQRQLRK